MKLFPRGLASLTLALAAVPGVAPLTAPGSATAPIPAHVPSPVPMIPVPGGWVPQDPDSPGVRQAATFAVTTLGHDFGHPYVVERIKAAASEVVSGENIKIRMRIAQVQDEILGDRKDCTVVVWWRAWMNPADTLTSYTCQSEDAS
jgi:hypothetical protein